MSVIKSFKKWVNEAITPSGYQYTDQDDDSVPFEYKKQDEEDDDRPLVQRNRDRYYDDYDEDEEDSEFLQVGDPNDTRKVVSFDFDGVLHSTVYPYTIHPICYMNPRTWAPRRDVFRIIHKEAEKHKVVVVTARGVNLTNELWEFIHHFNLPIEEIYCTNDQPKLQILTRLKAIRHYDDNKSMAPSLEGSGCDFVLSLPPYMTNEEAEEWEENQYEVW